MSAVFTALGFVIDYTGGSLWNVSSNDWGVIGLISFVVFAGLTVYREADWASARKPEITVTPEINNERAKLVVTNNGGEGNFTAKARVRASLPGPELYTMYWESVSDVSCHIDGGGGVASILVGRRARSNYIDKLALQEGDTSRSYLKGDLLLLKMGAKGPDSFAAFSQATWKEVRDGKEVNVYTNADRCILEVTITATPTLRKKWGTRKYLCEIEDGQIKLYETELSVPHVARIGPDQK